MLDHITRGRVVLGHGDRPPGARLRGVRRAARGPRGDLRGDRRRARAGARGEPYAYEGRFFHERRPTSRRSPTPARGRSSGSARTRRAGSSAPAGAPTAGSSTRSATSTSPRGSPRTYRASALAHGKEPRIALFREAWIGETREECERVWGPHALAVHRLYYNVGVYHEALRAVGRRGARPGRLHARPARPRAASSTASPDEVRATVEEWRAITGARLPGAPVPPPRRPDATSETLEALRLLRRRGDRAARRRGGVAVSRRYTGDWIVTSLLVDRAERFADEVAIAAEDGHATYAELVERAARVAALLDGARRRSRATASRRCSRAASTTSPPGTGSSGRARSTSRSTSSTAGTFLEHVLRDSGATVLVRRRPVAPAAPRRSTSATCGTCSSSATARGRAARRRRGARVRRRAGARPARPPSRRGDRPHVHHVHVRDDRAVARARCTATAARSTTSCPSSRASTSGTTTSATRCSPSSTRWGARRARPRRSGSGTASSCARRSRRAASGTTCARAARRGPGTSARSILFLWQQEPRARRPRPRPASCVRLERRRPS